MTIATNQLRIIGGKWRNRKIKFSADVEIRPTPNRIRETLFNWLVPHIEGAICLDLFAGSGALGFEALSRGARHITMVDKSPEVIKTLKKNAVILGTRDIEFFCIKFSLNLKNFFTHKFNIVFLDPPFYKNLVKPCSQWLEQQNCLTDEAFIYIEAESSLKILPVPSNWQIYRSKIAGQVRYSLLHRK
jgi:16S rRNA (guanine966-N2)-methyltransferase